MIFAGERGISAAPIVYELADKARAIATQAVEIAMTAPTIGNMVRAVTNADARIAEIAGPPPPETPAQKPQPSTGEEEVFDASWLEKLTKTQTPSGKVASFIVEHDGAAAINEVAQATGLAVETVIHTTEVFPGLLGTDPDGQVIFAPPLLDYNNDPTE